MTPTLTTNGKRVADALVEADVLVEHEGEYESQLMVGHSDLNRAAEILFGAPQAEGVGLREALIGRLDRLAKDAWTGSVEEWTQQAVLAMHAASKSLAALAQPTPDPVSLASSGAGVEGERCPVCEDAVECADLGCAKGYDRNALSTNTPDAKAPAQVGAVEGLGVSLDAIRRLLDEVADHHETEPHARHYLREASASLADYRDEAEAILADAPGRWTAWEETEADSDPSDPDCGYSTSWMVGWSHLGARDEDHIIRADTEAEARLLAANLNRLLTARCAALTASHPARPGDGPEPETGVELTAQGEKVWRALSWSDEIFSASNAQINAAAQALSAQPTKPETGVADAAEVGSDLRKTLSAVLYDGLGRLRFTKDAPLSHVLGMRITVGDVDAALASAPATRPGDEVERVIKLSPYEIQSGLDRVRYAELLIRQLPKDHDGRNTWLLNYGRKAPALNTTPVQSDAGERAK